EPAVEPTCESPGMTAYYRCSVCEEAEIPSEEYGEPLNHDWAETLTQGEITHYYACTRPGCDGRKGEEVHKQPVLATTLAFVEATCKTPGYIEYAFYCTVCGKEMEHKTDSIGLFPNNHEGPFTLVSQTPATCVSPGHTLSKCEACGMEFWEETPIDPNAHNLLAELIPGKAATCTETGLTDGERCPDCKAILTVQKEIPALTHDWGEWKQTKAPTCLEEGDKTRTCKRDGCGATEMRPVDVIAHDWDTSVWITDGSKHWHKCKTPGCSAITDEAAHSGGMATCQAKAKCAVCGEDYGEKSTENHAGGTKKVYYTEGDTGYEYYVVCLSCGEKTGETGVTPYDDETFDPSTGEWDYGEILVPGS
ncbi:MAG: hypothetical protein IKL25_07115, partial [Clostridia bacterium]|nr:hypothetical protein [Clostridia bacterium]